MKQSEGKETGKGKKVPPKANMVKSLPKKPAAKKKRVTTIPRDKKYLDWIKTCQCLEQGTGCLGDIIPHHTETGGTGIKGSDYSAVPLCNHHHNDWHDSSGKKGGLSPEKLKEITGRLKAVYDGQQPKEAKPIATTDEIKEHTLTEKEERFCLEYAASDNKVKSFMHVWPNYSYGAANVEAHRLLHKSYILQRVTELQIARRERLTPTADRILAELVKLSFYDPREFFDSDGRLKPINELDPDHAAVIAGVETIHKTTGDNDDGITVLTKIKLPNKNESLEKLGKNLMLWKEAGTKANPFSFETASDEDIDTRLKMLEMKDTH